MNTSDDIVTVTKLDAIKIEEKEDGTWLMIPFGWVGWYNGIKIDENVFINLKKEIKKANKKNLKFTNLKEIISICKNLQPKEDNCEKLTKINYTTNSFDFVNDRKTYLMKDNNTKLYKIGFSNNPKHRERTLQSEKPSIKMVKTWNKNIEKKLHKLYSEYRVRGEWFNLTPIQVKYICTKF
tara:strand:- start:44 stop:586 length:543 start_codon:yes stop_codon:yes gene_type:complete